jgi:long-subunit acyl-CoA synthetase (AMP-forming)
VLIRGAANFSGYYKQQQMTDEVLERDGWFHTGGWVRDRELTGVCRQCRSTRRSNTCVH